MSTCIKRLFIVCMLATLAGCSGLQQAPVPPPVDSAETWDDVQASLQQLNHWTLDGKIGIRTPDDNQSARLYWQQNAQHYSIELSGPLGQGGLKIEGEPGAILLDLGGDDRYVSSSPEQLLQETLGWSLPVQEIRWWVRGLPAPEQPHTAAFQGPRLQTLSQAGWTIEYQRYQRHQKYTLPGKIKLSHNGLRITLIIKEWSVRI